MIWGTGCAKVNIITTTVKQRVVVKIQYIKQDNNMINTSISSFVSVEEYIIIIK